MIFHISRELFLHFNIKRLENFFTFIYPRVADGRRGTGERTNYNKNLDFTSHSTRIISRKQLGMSSSMPADAGAMSSLEGSVFRRVSKNTIVRTAFSLFFFFRFSIFLPLFVSFCVSSSSPRSICEVDDTAAPRRTGRQVDFRARRRRSLLSNIRGRTPCRAAGGSLPRRTPPRGSGNRKYVVRGMRATRPLRRYFVSRAHDRPRLAPASVSIFIRALDHLREKGKLDLSPSFVHLQIRLKRFESSFTDLHDHVYERSLLSFAKSRARIRVEPSDTKTSYILSVVEEQGEGMFLHRYN